jgi:hypothetical protein
MSATRDCMQLLSKMKLTRLIWQPYYCDLFDSLAYLTVTNKTVSQRKIAAAFSEYINYSLLHVLLLNSNRVEA